MFTKNMLYYFINCLIFVGVLFANKQSNFMKGYYDLTTIQYVALLGSLIHLYSTGLLIGTHYLESGRLNFSLAPFSLVTAGMVLAIMGLFYVVFGLRTSGFQIFMGAAIAVVVQVMLYNIVEDPKFQKLE